MKLFIILLFMSSYAAASCRYEMIEQNGKYFAIQKVLGDLPNRDAKIEENLKFGINDIDFTNQEDQENEDDKIEKSRVKVRFRSEDKEAVKKYLKLHCPYGYN